MTVPGGSSGLGGWTLEFDAGFDITNIWNAVIVSHIGNHYVIRDADWNASVAPGGQASFGFQASTSSANTTASNLVLDDPSAPPPPVLPTRSGLGGWTLEFDAGFDITNIWNAVIVSHIGNHYVIRDADWNASVAPGGQASFGFQASTSSANTTASNLVLDDPSAPPPPVLPT